MSVSWQNQRTERIRGAVTSALNNSERVVHNETGNSEKKTKYLDKAKIHYTGFPVVSP